MTDENIFIPCTKTSNLENHEISTVVWYENWILFSDSRQSSKQQTGMDVMFVWWYCTVASFVGCQNFWQSMLELN